MADGNMNYLYTVGGYATLFGLGYAIYHVSTQRAGRRGAAPAPRATRGTQNEPRKEDRKKKQRMESFASEAQEAAKAKARVQAAAPAAPQASFATQDASEDGADNREFAKQLAKAQEGKTFASSGDNHKQKEKSVKQSRANKLNNGSSNDKQSDVVAEARDSEQAVTESPEIRPADASGVSDMLEAASSGPSILRITDSDKVREKEKMPKTAKVPEKAETKKQRQNRKKAEAAKEVRAEAELERKALEEKQRRAARVADGRPAKDGSQFTAAAVANSAWTNGATNGAGSKPAVGGSTLHQPLDTFEAPTATKQQATTTKPAAAKSGNDWVSSLPSEEEQLEMIKDDEWNTVPTKSSKKTAKKNSESSEDVSKAPLLAAQPNKAQPPAPKPANAAANAFSALTNDDTAEEVEEEWDV